MESTDLDYLEYHLAFFLQEDEEEVWLQFDLFLDLPQILLYPFEFGINLLRVIALEEFFGHLFLPQLNQLILQLLYSSYWHYRCSTQVLS